MTLSPTTSEDRASTTTPLAESLAHPNGSAYRPSRHRRVSEGLANTLYFKQPLPQQHPRLNPQHPVPQPCKASIPLGISASPPPMLRAINLNDEPATGANKVTDVPGDDDLTPKRNAELAVHDRVPKHRFRRRHVSAHTCGARFEKSLSFCGERASAQESLLGPAKRPGAGPFAQSLCQAPTVQRLQLRAWRRGCAPAEARPRPGPRWRAHECASIDDRASTRAEGRS